MAAGAGPPRYSKASLYLGQEPQTVSVGNISAQHTAASLEGQIRAAREQLNDWVTCVSATTPKGQAEIRSLSAQISAAQEHINRLAGRAGAVDTAAAPSGSVDVWA